MTTQTLRLNKQYVIVPMALMTAVFVMYAHVFLPYMLPIITLAALFYAGEIKAFPFYRNPAILLFALLLTWMGLSIVWTENQSIAIQIVSSLSAIFLCSLLLFSCTIRATPALISKAYDFIKFSGIFLISILTLQLCIDNFGDNPAYSTKLKPVGLLLGLTAFVSCAFLWIHKNRLLAILVFFLLAALISLTKCQTAFYGLLLASSVFGFSYLAPYITTYVVMISSYTFLLLSPLLYNYIFPAPLAPEMSSWSELIDKSLLHRWVAWEYYSKKFFEKPSFGWGLGSSKDLYSPSQTEMFPGFRKLIHPHNSSVQAFVELGTVGGILFSLFFASLFYLVAKYVKDRLSIAVCNATIVYAFLCAEATHSAWRGYWLSAAALTAGLMILLIKAREAQLHEPIDRLGQLRALLKEWELQQSGGIGNRQAT